MRNRSAFITFIALLSTVILLLAWGVNANAERSSKDPAATTFVEITAPLGVPARVDLTSKKTGRILESVVRDGKQAQTTAASGVDKDDAVPDALPVNYKGDQYEADVESTTESRGGVQVARHKVRYQKSVVLTNIRLKTITSTSVAFTWQSNSKTISVRRLDGVRNDTVASHEGRSVLATKSGFTDRGLKAGTQYTYAIFYSTMGRARNKGVQILLHISTRKSNSANSGEYQVKIGSFILPKSGYTSIRKREKNVAEIDLLEPLLGVTAGAGILLQPSATLHEGAIIVVKEVINSGKTVIVTPGGIADVFAQFHYKSTNPIRLQLNNSAAQPLSKNRKVTPAVQHTLRAKQMEAKASTAPSYRCYDKMEEIEISEILSLKDTELSLFPEIHIGLDAFSGGYASLSFDPKLTVGFEHKKSRAMEFVCKVTIKSPTYPVVIGGIPFAIKSDQTLEMRIGSKTFNKPVIHSYTFGFTSSLYLSQATGPKPTGPTIMPPATKPSGDDGWSGYIALSAGIAPMFGLITPDAVEVLGFEAEVGVEINFKPLEGSVARDFFPNSNPNWCTVLDGKASVDIAVKAEIILSRYLSWAAKFTFGSTSKQIPGTPLYKPSECSVFYKPVVPEPSVTQPPIISAPVTTGPSNPPPTSGQPNDPVPPPAPVYYYHDVRSMFAKIPFEYDYDAGVDGKWVCYDLDPGPGVDCLTASNPDGNQNVISLSRNLSVNGAPAQYKPVIYYNTSSSPISISGGIVLPPRKIVLNLAHTKEQDGSWFGRIILSHTLPSTEVAKGVKMQISKIIPGQGGSLVLRAHGYSSAERGLQPTDSRSVDLTISESAVVTLAAKAGQHAPGTTYHEVQYIGPESGAWVALEMSTFGCRTSEIGCL